MATTVKCKKCDGKGEHRRGVKCKTCGGTGIYTPPMG